MGKIEEVISNMRNKYPLNLILLTSNWYILGQRDFFKCNIRKGKYLYSQSIKYHIWKFSKNASGYQNMMTDVQKIYWRISLKDKVGGRNTKHEGIQTIMQA